MNTLFYIPAALLLIPVIAVRLIFLIPGRLGWINYLANVFSEFFVKKIRWSRTAVEIVMALLGLGLLFFAGSGWLSVGLALACLLSLELYVSKVERWLLATSFTPIDSIGLRRATQETTRGLANGYPTPSTHPELMINLAGPFIARMPHYELGTLMVGRRFELRLVIGNHTIVPTQTGIRVRVAAPAALRCEQNIGELLPRLASGEVHELNQTWNVQSAAGAGEIRFIIEWGHFRQELGIHFDGCRLIANATIASAGITRYPGGCRSAFAWRGDMDLYDESTLQSIEGLEVTLSLAARYRLPQTMYLSSRLSLDEASARQWGEHYGADRGFQNLSGGCRRMSSCGMIAPIHSRPKNDFCWSWGITGTCISGRTRRARWKTAGSRRRGWVRAFIHGLAAIVPRSASSATMRSKPAGFSKNISTTRQKAGRCQTAPMTGSPPPRWPPLAAKC